MVDFDKFNNVRGGGWFIVHSIIPTVFKATPHFASQAGIGATRVENT